MDQRLFCASEPNLRSGTRIVASALAVPAEAELFDLDQTRTGRGEIAVHAVDDQFYRYHCWGLPVTSRPEIVRIPALSDLVAGSDLRQAWVQATEADD
jgi:hypothetical protein